MFPKETVIPKEIEELAASLTSDERLRSDFAWALFRERWHNAEIARQYVCEREGKRVGKDEASTLFRKVMDGKL